MYKLLSNLQTTQNNYKLKRRQLEALQKKLWPTNQKSKIKNNEILSEQMNIMITSKKKRLKDKWCKQALC